MLFAKSRSPRVPVATRNSRVPLARGHAIRQGPRPSPGSVPLATIALRLAYSTAYTPYTCPYVLMYAVLLDDRLDIIRRVCVVRKVQGCWTGVGICYTCVYMQRE